MSDHRDAFTDLAARETARADAAEAALVKAQDIAIAEFQRLHTIKDAWKADAEALAEAFDREWDLWHESHGIYGQRVDKRDCVMSSCQRAHRALAAHEARVKEEEENHA
jgi:hypothetical protein